jgi:thiamine-monophosphate kinase
MNKDNQQFTQLSELGEFGLIEHLAKHITIQNPSTLKGIGDDAAVFQYENEMAGLITCDMLIEGIHFKPTYTPLKHLGYKAAVVNFSDIYAMNGIPRQMIVGLAVSAKYTLEAIEELYSGMILACQKYGVDFVGGDTTSTPHGMQISVSVVGAAQKKDITYRNGAMENDLICVSGDLGAAYAGLLILEREEKTFLANPKYQPDIEMYEYVIERQLKPEAGKKTIETLQSKGIRPTAMIDISDGLASELFHICKQSDKGCKIFEDKIPIDQQTYDVAEEFSIVPLTFALNGGEDYELLFTVNIEHFDLLQSIPEIKVIGHITSDTDGKYIITSHGQAIEMKAQGWDALKK